MASLPTPLQPGDFAPWFTAPALSGNRNYVFDSAGGRVVLMLFFGSATHPAASAALAKALKRRSLFDDVDACFFGVSVDPSDEKLGRIRQQLPGVRFFLDFDRQVSRSFGAAGDGDAYRGYWLLLDRTLRVVGRFALSEGEAALAAAAKFAATAPAPDWAPVALIPNVFEPDLCKHLIAQYEANGGEESGFMRDVGGITREVTDPKHKVRRDFLIEEERLAKQLNLRIYHRLRPMVNRVFQFNATRVERLLVACYEAETGGHFAPHRDNTTKGTAHRRFAVTINLNAEDYEGGDLQFPEYGSRTYRAPTGGAVIFSCSLLHTATRVTAGRRFAFLPFLYDEAGAKLREENSQFTEGELRNYRAANDVVVECGAEKPA